MIRREVHDVHSDREVEWNTKGRQEVVDPLEEYNASWSVMVKGKVDDIYNSDHEEEVNNLEEKTVYIN